MGISCRILAGFLLFSLFISFFFCSEAADTLLKDESLRNNGSLISKNEFFELGFFNPRNSSFWYLGIWYYKIERTYIWVANREKPLANKDGVLRIREDGNLNILDSNNVSVWTSNVTVNVSDSTKLRISNDGELILSSRDDESRIYWRSFDHPTDTFLPEMRVRINSTMGENRMFFSWKSENDPSTGNFCLGVDPRGALQIVIWERGIRRWRSGHWDQQRFSGIPNMRATSWYGFRISSGELTYHPLNSSDKLRFQIRWDGIEEQQRWDERNRKWEILQKLPVNSCDFYNRCGNFAVCVESNRPQCSCVPGFVPKNNERWSKGNWTDGCERKSSLLEERNVVRNSSTNGTEENGEVDGFLSVDFVKLPDFITLVRLDFGDSCKDKCLNNSSCIAYSEPSGIGCMIWDGPLIDIQKFDGAGNRLNVRVAHSDLESVESERKLSVAAIVLISLGGVVFIAALMLLLWKFRDKLKVLPSGSSKQTQNSTEVPIYDLSKSREFSTDLSGPYELGIEGDQVNGPDLPSFNFNCVAVATENFSEKNKLGQGGFGPVYKGKLPSGQEIAVKRLSVQSGQGLEEFKNEIILIAKLQHRNLVRLLGYCIQGEDKMLLYEYMPNKSLDWFLFDPAKRALLDWKMRLSIIEGIARGLLYLHRDSRLRIIHRDLKASNILLDEDMIPKISDFGMARIFGGNQNEANTIRVVGTYGYMAPEYAMEGLFSVKSDVYSFGVLLLELICGRRNVSFRSTEYMTIIGYAWQLWNEGKAMELLDPSLRDSSPENEVMKCIHVGMLCVQDSPAFRPTMQSLVLMLESESAALLPPRQPTFTSTRASIDTDLFTEGHDIASSNDVTITSLDGR